MDAGELNDRHHVHNVVPTGSTVGRRRFLELAAAAGFGVLVAPHLMGTTPAAGAVPTPVPDGYSPSFPDGIMSGDPSPDGAVLWTRLAPPAGDAPVTVSWEVATDDEFAVVVAGGSAEALAVNGHTVKVAVTGLASDGWYHYRFTAGDVSTVTGRLRTAPAPGTTPDKLVFAWASCQQRSDRSLYVAHSAIANEPDIDFWMHLGDYVYVSDGGTLTVPDYRGVYAQFKSNQRLQDLQARVPTVAMFDDGEFVNGVHKGIPAERLSAALKVWFEQFPVIPPDGADTRAHRRFAWGDLLDMFMLDVRQYRDAEVPESDPTLAPDRERFNPDRTTLGLDQRNWLVDGLTASTAAWRTLGNPYNMGMWRLGPKSEPEPGKTFTSNFRDLDNVHVNQGTYAPNEAWDDFWFERKFLLDHLQSEGIDNVISVSGHTHIWLADVLIPDPDDPDSPVVAFDFTCGSLTADPDFSNLNYAGVNFNGNANAAYPTMDTIARVMEDSNPWKAYVNFINQGYGLATITAERAVVEFKAINTYDPDAEPDVVARFTIEAGATTMRVELWPVPCYTCTPGTKLRPVVPSRMFPPDFPYAGFADVKPSDGHATAVNWLAVNGITTGVSATRFDPTGVVLRRQMALFLWRMMDKPVVQSRSGFTDVPTTGDLAKALDWLDASGITVTTPRPGQPKRFQPGGLVTRAQMAAFLWRMAGSPTGYPQAQFTDVRRGDYFAVAVDWLAHFGISTGVSPTRYAPQQPVNRAQMSLFLWRLASTPAAWDSSVTLPGAVRR
jgi:alkaline phosphatase D